MNDENMENMIGEQNGGNVLSEGAYGCVFMPRVGCDGKQTDDKKYISKIQVYDETANNEIEISKKVNNNIDTVKMMFAPVEETCNIDINKIEDGTKEECNILKKTNKKYINMKIRFVDKLIFFDYMKQETDHNIFNVFLDNYNYLLVSISKLVDNNIIHMDLKGNNIMMDTGKNIPIIIDFGLSIDMNKLTSHNNSMIHMDENRENLSTLNIMIDNKYLKQSFYVYGPDYFVWAPEIHYINYLVNVNDTPDKEEIKGICNSIIDGIIVLKRLYNEDFIDKMKIVLYNYYLRFHNKPKDECINILLSYSNSWDKYSLSMIFLRILSYIILNNNTSSLTEYNSKFIKSFSKILLYNIHPNPSKRYSMEKNIDQINKYIYYKSYGDVEFLDNMKTIMPNNEITSKIIKSDEEYISKISKDTLRREK